MSRSTPPSLPLSPSTSMTLSASAVAAATTPGGGVVDFSIGINDDDNDDESAVTVAGNASCWSILPISSSSDSLHTNTDTLISTDVLPSKYLLTTSSTSPPSASTAVVPGSAAVLCTPKLYLPSPTEDEDGDVSPPPTQAPPANLLDCGGAAAGAPHAVAVSLANTLQRHLLHSTSTQQTLNGSGNGRKLSVVSDVSLLQQPGSRASAGSLIDPGKTLQFLTTTPDIKTSQYDVMQDCSGGSFLLKMAPVTAVASSSTSTSSFAPMSPSPNLVTSAAVATSLSDIVPNLPNIPLACIDVSANLPEIVTDGLDLTGLGNIAVQASPKIRQGGSNSSGVSATLGNNGTLSGGGGAALYASELRLAPNVSTAAATGEFRLLPDTSAAMSANATSIRLFDNATPGLRLVTSEAPSPVRLLPDINNVVGIAAAAKEQQIRLLPPPTPGVVAVTASVVPTPTPAPSASLRNEPVHLLPDCQLVETPTQIRLVPAPSLPVVSASPAPSSSALQQSNKDPILVDQATSSALATAALGAAAASSPVLDLAYVTTSPTSRMSSRKKSGPRVGSGYSTLNSHRHQQPGVLPTTIEFTPHFLEPISKAEPPVSSAATTGAIYLKQVSALPSSSAAPGPQPLPVSLPTPPAAPAAITSSSTGVNLSRKRRRQQRVETIACFKCTVCGFLGMSIRNVEEHMFVEHGTDLSGGSGASSDEEGDSGFEWLSTAQKEGIKLACASCPNTFNGESSRSFVVHLMDDHGESEEEARRLFKVESQKRKAATVAFLKKKRQEEREKRRRMRKDLLEAYVDDNGELRVRNVRFSDERAGPSAKEVFANDSATVDVSAREYVEAMDAAKKTASSTGGNEQKPPPPNERQKVLIGISERVNKIAKQSSSSSSSGGDSVVGKKSSSTSPPCDGDVFPPVDSDPDVDDLASVPQEPVAKRKRPPGRPKGARSLGITKLKRFVPSIELSDDHCGVDDCAVRLREQNNLDYHRRCHVIGAGKTLFKCPECPSETEAGVGADVPTPTTTVTWQAMALHLWRRHRLDLELYSCDECDSYRSFSACRLRAHALTHRTDRPFICADCGKSFKMAKNLKLHQAKHEAERDPSKRPIKGTCFVCQRPFKELRLLKLHMETVHEKLRPHLCNYCGYTASSKSSLKLHLRGHTGEKPYSCDTCDYRTSDHNSLRRHKMQHSGEKPYKCPHCTYSCIQSSTFKTHLRSKHPNETDNLVFHCQHCLFKTVQEGNFLTHLAEHGRLGDNKALEDAGAGAGAAGPSSSHVVVVPSRKIKTEVVDLAEEKEAPEPLPGPPPLPPPLAPAPRVIASAASVPAAAKSKSVGIRIEKEGGGEAGNRKKSMPAAVVISTGKE